MATIHTRLSRVRVWTRGADGQPSMTMEWEGSAQITAAQERIDLTSLFDDTPRHVAGTMNVTIEMSNARAPSRHSLAEQMALAVLDGDSAAARALADLVCEDVSRAAQSMPTHDELLRRAEVAEIKVAELKGRLSVLEPQTEADGGWEVAEDQWDDLEV